MNLCVNISSFGLTPTPKIFNFLFLFQLTQICLVFINHNTEEAYFFDHYYFPFN